MIVERVGVTGLPVDDQRLPDLLAPVHGLVAPGRS